MTINSTENRASNLTDGVSTLFTFPYRFLLDEDLVVLLVNNSTGASTKLMLTTDYTVSGAGSPSGGSITTVATYPTGSTIVIYRDPSLVQLMDLVKNDKFPPDTVENAIDKLTMIAQRFKDIFSRAITLPDSYTGSASGALPSPIANYFLRWKSDASGLENADIGVLGAVGLPIVVAEGGTGAVTAADARTNLGAAPTASPTFTGTVTMTGATVNVPTAAAADNDTSVASTAFVQGELASGRNVNVPVRQTVLSGVLSSGVPAALTTGSGLLPGLDASPTPLAIAFANGFGAVGSVDTVSVVSADATTIGSALPANNTSFIYADRLSDTAVTWGQTLSPPQYGEAYNRTSSFVLNFEAADASTSIIDGFGNAFTAFGNAQIDTAQFKFGSSSLLVDGTTDYIITNSITSLPATGWTYEGWVRFNALPGNGAYVCLGAFASPTGFGATLYLFNNAGTYELRMGISSNTTSNNVLASTSGTPIATPTIGVWYHFAMTHDLKNGAFRNYWNGVAAQGQASTEFIGAIDRVVIGTDYDGTANPLNGWLDGLSFVPYCKYPAATTFTPPATAPAVEGHFFSIPEMKMYEVTGASGTAGTDPTMTRRDRVFVGECATGAATVSSAITYAYRGRYIGSVTVPAAATRVSWAHNLGVGEPLMNCRMISRVNIGNYRPGDSTMAGIYSATGPYLLPALQGEGRNTASFVCGPNGIGGPNRTNGTPSDLSIAAGWSLQLNATRGW